MVELNVTNDPVIEALRKEAAEKLNLSMETVKASRILKDQAAADAKSMVARFGAVGARKLAA